VPVELRPTSVAAGGAAVARGDDGRVVFVAGALPGERVLVEVTEEKKRWSRGHTVEVLEPSTDRVAPPCPHVADGCGGCTWQHVAHDAQEALKATIVRDALVRLGGVEKPEVHAGPVLAARGFRTSVRAAVEQGRAGFRREHSHDIVVVDSCLVTHPLVEEVLVGGRFPGAHEVTVRCGARTGERLVLPRPADTPIDVPADVRHDHFHEEVAGVRFRISAPSFFQARPDGADALVAAVRDAAAGAPDGPMIDAYGGVGLFAATVGAGRPVTLVEWSSAAVADARVNVPDAQVLRLDLARWRPSPAALVIADPSRAGLGAPVVRTLARTGASHLVLVSCDPASLGRDTALLRAAGFEHDVTTLVDLFPHTPHVEAVTRFIREGAPLRTTR
jgi:23S rRNA (uracil1939-C5)-methyltransferase